MSFLSKISNIRKSIPATTAKNGRETDKKVKTDDYSILPKNYVRDEDPAVRRLKELRRQELLKKGELSKKARSQSTPNPQRKKKNSDDMYPTETRFKKKVGTSKNVSRPVSVPSRSEPLKKLSFEELMKQAENNAHEKASNKAASPPQRAPVQRPKKEATSHSFPRKVGFKKKIDRNIKPATSTEVVRQKAAPHEKKPEPVRIRTIGAGLAKPNEKIRKQLEQRKQQSRRPIRDEESESDMDDFIEDDTGEMNDRWASQHEADYDRDEIWALFNRGKRRSEMMYDDYDDDDMEANEMEILEEEEKAGRMARLEDKREEQWLKKHEQEKKRRKRMKG